MSTQKNLLLQTPSARRNDQLTVVESLNDKKGNLTTKYIENRSRMLPYPEKQKTLSSDTAEARQDAANEAEANQQRELIE